MALENNNNPANTTTVVNETEQENRQTDFSGILSNSESDNIDNFRKEQSEQGYDLFGDQHKTEQENRQTDFSEILSNSESDQGYDLFGDQQQEVVIGSKTVTDNFNEPLVINGSEGVQEVTYNDRTYALSNFKPKKDEKNNTIIISMDVKDLTANTKCGTISFEVTRKNGLYEVKTVDPSSRYFTFFDSVNQLVKEGIRNQVSASLNSLAQKEDGTIQFQEPLTISEPIETTIDNRTWAIEPNNTCFLAYKNDLIVNVTDNDHKAKDQYTIFVFDKDTLELKTHFAVTRTERKTEGNQSANGYNYRLANPFIPKESMPKLVSSFRNLINIDDDNY